MRGGRAEHRSALKRVGAPRVTWILSGGAVLHREISSRDSPVSNDRAQGATRGTRDQGCDDDGGH
jgi:hypothetical protein